MCSPPKHLSCMTRWGNDSLAQRSASTTAPTSKLLRGLRAQGERGFALLTERWRALQRMTLAPTASATSPNPRSYSPTTNTATQLSEENLTVLPVTGRD